MREFDPIWLFELAMVERVDEFQVDLLDLAGEVLALGIGELVPELDEMLLPELFQAGDQMFFSDDDRWHLEDPLLNPGVGEQAQCREQQKYDGVGND